MIRQLSIFAENKKGAMNRITQILRCDLTDPDQRLAIQIVLSAQQAAGRTEPPGGK